MDETAATWPFWAPSATASVEAALDLAGVQAGETVADLGCGDGQVLVAAAARGAAAVGVEMDPALARAARRALKERGLAGTVTKGDLLLDPLPEADVYFTYLAPATLQRLLPRLPRGARLVTVDFDVPDLRPDETDGAARLYRLPGRRLRIGPSRAAWGSGGSLVTAPPDSQSLHCLTAVHPGGRVTARASRGLAPHLTLLTGADHLDRRSELAVDLRCEALPTGTVAGGTVTVAGVEPHPVFVVVADDDDGLWDLSPEGVTALRAALRRKHRPATTKEMIEAATV
jgi:SAM-dependent methyltransferase